MSWVPGFNHDVFLSYARVDNLTASDPEFAWVTQFHRHLEIELSKKAGQEGAVSIWKDSREIPGNGLFDQIIEQAIRDSAIFVALVSNGYLVSEYCNKELRTFFAKAQADPSLIVGDRYRIFNVQIQAISASQWPSEFGQTTGFAFHEVHPGWDEPTPPNSALYREQMHRLVAAIYDTLARMRSLVKLGPQDEKPVTADSFPAYDEQTLYDTDESRSVKVFISYSHDSAAQEDRVLELANRLRADGIDATIDQYEQTPAEGWAFWVEKQMRTADFILVVCTEKYGNLLEGKDKPKEGLGSNWEGNLIYQYLYNAGTFNARFIPVVFGTDSIRAIPATLRGSTYYSLETASGYDQLYRRLTSQPSVLHSRRRAHHRADMVQRISSASPLRVFLCHSSSDKAVVRSLYDRLLAAGVSPWLDEENLLPGQLWDGEIAKAVRASDVILVCLSRSSVSKQGYVHKEIRYALDVVDEKPEGTVYLIPLRLEACEVPERLRRWQWVDLFEPTGFDKLMKSLMRQSAASLPSITPSPPAARGSRIPGPSRVFVSYARTDEPQFKALEKHLTLLQHQAIIEGWSVRVVEEYPNDEIREDMQHARLILLLVSPDYLASEYCYSLEMQRAMERHQIREARVIPIIIRPCAWSLTPLSDLPALPTGNLAVSEWRSRDAALLDITRSISKAAQQHLA